MNFRRFKTMPFFTSDAEPGARNAERCAEKESPGFEARNSTAEPDKKPKTEAQKPQDSSSKTAYMDYVRKHQEMSSKIK